ncbi:hypothetical protein MHYP_G00137440 [Metynnis hypsauchen]
METISLKNKQTLICSPDKKRKAQGKFSQATELDRRAPVWAKHGEMLTSLGVASLASAFLLVWSFWGIQWSRVAGTSLTCLIYDVSPWTEGSRAQVLKACVMVRGVEWKLSPGGKRRSRDLLNQIND